MEAPPKPRELPPAYDPAGLETAWYGRWESAGVFRGDAAAAGSGRAPFVITLPPPNVTGVLHMGHVLNHTLQDLLVRWKRMSGAPTLFLPGSDHAGIATQNMVERKLAKEGRDRRTIGRDAFLVEVRAWKNECESRIVEQMKRLGDSCDWTRYRFTLDEGLSRAVVEVFVRLHEKGLIYRGKRLINWCPGCRTALSDEEVEHEEVSGNLYHVEYSVDGGEPVVIATTRPETMLGDTAVAVHPDDERYRALVGKMARLPILGRALPIVADAVVDSAFGTGALKVTPGHDPVDFEIGQRHGLPALEMMDEAGRVTGVGGKFAGMDRFVARKAIVKELEALGALKKVEPHRRAVGHCYRCRTIVEPILSTQWFVRMKPLAEPAIAAVRDGRTTFEPARWTKVYNHWMENIRDWCVSRQLWWGHRIPAWYCVGDEGEGAKCTLECRTPIVARTKPDACPCCGSTNLRQDDDVLDTWFSSWLWPFSTLGWPERTADLAAFFPSSVLVTANEILFFWVARMIMASIEFMGEPPFQRVLIHGIVRDDKGRKMSKTLGNSPDPIDLMERVGADALRFSIVYTTPSGQDVLFSEKSLEMGRHLANKLWNAGRLILSRIEGRTGGWEGIDLGPDAIAQPASMRREDRWILTRTHRTIRKVTEEIDALHSNEAMSSLYDFFWHDFCDWYLEHAKLRQDSGDADYVSSVLARVYRATLALFHPVMPYITEEISSCFPWGGRLLATGPWPSPDDFPSFESAEEEFAHSQRILSSIRMLRSETGIPPGVKVDVHINPKDQVVRTILSDSETTITALGRINRLDLDYKGITYPRALAQFIPASGIVFLPVEGLIDIDKERGRLGKEIDRLQEQLTALRRKLADEKFLERAPDEVVVRERDKERQFADKLAGLEKNRDMLSQ